MTAMTMIESTPSLSGGALHQSIRDILLSAKTQVRQTVNTAMVQTYWQIGRLIVENEQGGEKRAEYGKRVLPELAKRLSAEFGKGFSLPNLRNFRQFYLNFSMDEIRYSLRSELSWSHFRCLMRVENKTARAWYANEAATQGWSVRALDRQISTLYYERLLGSQKQEGVREEAANKIAVEVASDPRDFCSERNAAVAKYSALADSQQLFASKYQTFLPSEEELRAELERDRALLEAAVSAKIRS